MYTIYLSNTKFILIENILIDLIYNYGQKKDVQGNTSFFCVYILYWRAKEKLGYNIT